MLFDNGSYNSIFSSIGQNQVPSGQMTFWICILKFRLKNGER